MWKFKVKINGKQKSWIALQIDFLNLDIPLFFVVNILKVNRLFKAFTPQTLLILLIFSILLKLKYLSITSLSLPELQQGGSSSNWLMYSIQKSFGVNSIIYPILVIINLILQSLWINRIASEYKLFPQASFIPAATFIMVSSLFVEWNTLSAPMLATWPILFAINNMLRMSITSTPQKLLFNSGMFVALASLIYLPALLFALYLIWSLILLKSVRIKDIILILLGILTPVYFTIGLGYLLEWNWIQSLPLIKVSIIPIKEIINNHKYLPSIITFVVLIILGIFRLNQMMDRMLESAKTAWWNLIIVFIFGFVIALFPFSNEHSSWYFLLAPSSLLIASVWNCNEGKWLKIGTFWALIFFIIYIQYFQV